MTAQTGVIIPIQTTDAGKAQVKTALDNLGSQMSQLVQSYNDQRTAVEAENKTELREKMHELFEARRAAIRNLVEQFKAAASSAAAQGIQPGVMPPTLAGMGSFELSGLQTAVATEQSKLAALAAYYESAKAAIAAGQPIPPTPTELGGSVLGMSTTTLAIFAAIAAAAYFMFFNKN